MTTVTDTQVTEPEADASKHTVAEQEEPELVVVHTDGADEEAEAEAHRAREHRLARAHAIEPGAEHRRRQSQKDDCEAEHPRDFGYAPVGRRRCYCIDELRLRQRAQRIRSCELAHGDELRQRLVEHAEGVRLTNRQVNRQRSRRNEPAIEARLRKAPFTIEEGQ